MRHGGFTLIELLVVLAVISLLVAIVFPTLRSAHAMARMVKCQSNIRQIQVACATHSAREGSDPARPYPNAYVWPSTPKDTVGAQGIYLCPERPTGFHARVDDASAYGVHTTQDDMVIPFADIEDHCILVDHGDYEEYRFEAGRPDNSRDFDDVVFYVSKERPRVATFTPDDPSRPYRGIQTAVMSLRLRGKVVPGWEDFRDVKSGAQVTFLSDAGGVTSYGINVDADRLRLGDKRIVLLDYEQSIANEGEDVPELLEQSARHMGKINVLLANESISSMRPDKIDPTRHADLWLP